MNILMSIKPEWCKKIIYGDKTIEVRKTKPEQISVPFKVYVYATFGGENWFSFGKQKSGHVIGVFTCDKIERYDIPYPACQKDMNPDVKEKSCLSYMQLHRYAGEQDMNPDVKEKSCLSYMQLHRYAGEQGYVYGWHIHEFENWNKPLSIREFIDSKGNHFKRPPQSWAYGIRAVKWE